MGGVLTSWRLCSSWNVTGGSAHAKLAPLCQPDEDSAFCVGVHQAHCRSHTTAPGTNTLMSIRATARPRGKTFPPRSEMCMEDADTSCTTRKHPGPPWECLFDLTKMHSRRVVWTKQLDGLWQTHRVQKATLGNWSSLQHLMMAVCSHGGTRRLNTK